MGGEDSFGSGIDVGYDAVAHNDANPVGGQVGIAIGGEYNVAVVGYTAAVEGSAKAAGGADGVAKDELEVGVVGGMVGDIEWVVGAAAPLAEVAVGHEVVKQVGQLLHDGQYGYRDFDIVVGMVGDVPAVDGGGVTLEGEGDEEGECVGGGVAHAGEEIPSNDPSIIGIGDVALAADDDVVWRQNPLHQATANGKSTPLDAELAVVEVEDLVEVVVVAFHVGNVEAVEEVLPLHIGLETLEVGLWFSDVYPVDEGVVHLVVEVFEAGTAELQGTDRAEEDEEEDDEIRVPLTEDGTVFVAGKGAGE